MRVNLTSISELSEKEATKNEIHLTSLLNDLDDYLVHFRFWSPRSP